MSEVFTIWAAGDAHVGTDIRRGRTSLADALRQSEKGGTDGGPSFVWDIMLDVGDLSGSQEPPDDAEGRLVGDQYRILEDHDREQIYNIAGNHDASGPDDPDPQWWFRKWVDPLGDNPSFSGVEKEKRPFPVDGAWDHYKFTCGNVLVLMMSDRNDGGPPVGRGHRGGYPAGAVTAETFDWWVEQVESHQDMIIISVHHHMLKETTVGSGAWEGFQMEHRDRYGKPPAGYHGYFADGGPMGAGYLYWVNGNPDAQAFERYLSSHPGAIDLWIGGHTHTHPDDVLNGKGHIERKWDVTFLNCAALTKHHGGGDQGTAPMSRVLTFTPGLDRVEIRCYLHTSDHAPQGWHSPAKRVETLRHTFQHPKTVSPA